MVLISRSSKDKKTEVNMLKLRKRMAVTVLAGLFAFIAITGTSEAAPSLKALIIDGQMNPYHSWKKTSPVLKEIIEATGLFQVDITTAPGKGEPMDGFSPDFSSYDVLIMNYDGAEWPEETKRNFVDYIRSGGGLVVFHSADNAFPQWKEFNEIIGLGGWGGRNEKDGPMVRFRDGKVVLDHSPGPGGSHPPQHEFPVTVRDREHPVTAGLPETWMNGKDELYSQLRGPAKNLTVLATAYADPKIGGTGENEPILFTIDYGKGRIFHTTLGHGPENMHCVGFIYTLQRGTEWAATGKVTQTDVPLDFPTTEKASYRSSVSEPGKADWVELLSSPDFGAWRDPVGEWKIVGDAFIYPDSERRLASRPGTGVAVNGERGVTRHLVSKLEHGDIEAHVEFMVPKGSNSGVYFQGRYEIQVFDSWGVKNPQHSDCGGIYERWHDEPGLENSERGYEGRPPRVNASREPGKWQTFDVIFRAPRFDSTGNKIANAVFVKVVHNGVIVHENQEVTGPTRASLFNNEKPLGPLMLQGDHGLVAYRNVRIRPIAITAGAEVDDPYKAILSYDFGQSRKTLTGIEDDIRNATPEQRIEIESKLLEALGSPQATFACKQFVCKALRLVGSSRSLPALAELLKDKKLSHMARLAMQGMSESRVDELFREALGTLDGNLKIGVITSIGDRGDRQAVPQLAQLANSRDTAIAGAAISALGRIGGIDAVEALDRAKVGDTLDRARLDAYLMCAEKMLDQGENEPAAAIYRRMAARQNPSAIRIAAYRGLAKAERDDALPVLIPLLSDGNPDVRRGAATCLADIPGTDATRMFVSQLPSLSPDVQVVLIDALAARGDKVALPEVVRTASSDNEEVRLGALRALAVLGDSSNIDMLISAVNESGRIGDTAVYSLGRLRGTEIDTALVNRASASTDPDLKSKLIDVLATRHSGDALPALLEFAENDNSQVRKAAFRALAALAGPEDIQTIVSMLAVTDDPSDRRELERTLIAVLTRIDSHDAGIAAVTAGIETANSAGEASLLAVLGTLGGNRALQTVRGYLHNPESSVKSAAIRAMGQWPDPTPASDLLKVAENDPDRSNHILALRGYIRLAGLPSDRPVEETVGMYMKAMRTARRTEEQKLVLGGVSNVPDKAALAFVEGYLNHDEIGKEAEQAYKKISALIEGN